MTITTIIIQFLIHKLECFHDLNVIKGSDPNEFVYNSKWHFWDAWMWVMVHSGFAIILGNGALLATGLAFRFLMLQVLLNPLRGLPVTYLGSGFVDSFCRIYFGLTGTIVVKFILLAGFITLALL